MGIIEKIKQEIDSQFIYFDHLIDLIIDIEKCKKSDAIDWLLSIKVLEKQLLLQKSDSFSLVEYQVTYTSTGYLDVTSLVYDAYTNILPYALNELSEIGFPRKSILYALNGEGLQIPQELLDQSSSYIPIFRDDSDHYCPNSGSCGHIGDQLHAVELENKKLKDEIAEFKKQPKNEMGNPTVGHADISHYQAQRDQYKKQYEQLQAENTALKQQIENLNAQVNTATNEINEQDNQNRNSDLLFIAALMDMLVNEKRAYNQTNRLQEIENNANGITGLSVSRTTKVLADANKLYKPLKNKQMK